MTYELTIVGAGLVGATTALALANQNIRVRLIDSQAALPPSETPDLRVVALNLKSIQWLIDSGLWSRLDQSRLGIFTSLCIEDQGQSLCFDAASQALDKLGVIAENNHLISAAQTACLQHANILCEFSKPFLYDPEEPHLIIAADGAQSSLRQSLNIPCFTHDYDQMAWVAYVHLEKPHQQQAWQIFLPTGPLAFLPMQDPHMASIVWTLPKNHTDIPTGETISAASQYHYGAIQVISSMASFPLRLQLANSYFKNQVVFVGDAIHSIHPLAGQGVNLGFADAKLLTELLLTHKKTQWTHSLLLKRYQRERKSSNILMAHGMSAINTLFAQDNPWIVSARTQGLTCMGKSSFLKRVALFFASGLSD